MRSWPILLLLMVTSGAATAVEADSFVGSWQLDPSASRCGSNPCPASMVIVIEAIQGGIHYHSETKPAAGAVRTADYSARYDDRPVLVESSTGMMLPIALTRVDETTVLARYVRGFTVRARSRWVLDSERMSMSVTTAAISPSGEDKPSTTVFRRVAP